MKFEEENWRRTFRSNQGKLCHWLFHAVKELLLIVLKINNDTGFVFKRSPFPIQENI